MEALFAWLDAISPPFVWTFRTVAACMATFILINWFFHRGSDEERPPHNRKANETAWAFASAGAILGGVGFNAMDIYWLSVWAPNAPNATVATVWGLWAAALTYRASARAEQPRLIWLASAIIAGGGLLVISLNGEMPV